MKATKEELDELQVLWYAEAEKQHWDKNDVVLYGIWLQELYVWEHREVKRLTDGCREIMEAMRKGLHKSSNELRG